MTRRTKTSNNSGCRVLTAPTAGVSSSSSLSVAAFVPPHHQHHLHLHQPLMLTHRITLNPPLSVHTERCSQKRPEDGREGVTLTVKGFGLSRVSCHVSCALAVMKLKVFSISLFSPGVSLYVSDEDDYKSSQ